MHFLTHSLHYGLAAFEGIRAYAQQGLPATGAVFRLSEHTDRLFDSCKLCLIDVPYSREQVNAACIETMRALSLIHIYEAVGHLFRVAASLDSLVVGEPQILGQLKHAFRSAQEIGTVGPVLGALLPTAFAVAKRVRSETAIGENPASVASVAVQLAHQVFGSLHKA